MLPVASSSPRHHPVISSFRQDPAGMTLFGTPARGGRRAPAISCRPASCFPSLHRRRNAAYAGTPPGVSSEEPVMRKVILMMQVSLDGFSEGPEHDLSWHRVDEELYRLQDPGLGRLEDRGGPQRRRRGGGQAQGRAGCRRAAPSATVWCFCGIPWNRTPDTQKTGDLLPPRQPIDRPSVRCWRCC